MYMSKLLRPREIAKRSLINTLQGSDSENTRYQHILKLIKAGDLKAKNYGSKSRSYWLVHQAEIVRYNKAVNK